LDPITHKVTQTDVTDPLGYQRRVTFNADGYVLQDTNAWSLPEAQTTEADRPLRDNFVRTTTDPHLLQTAMTYDAMGNLTSVTRLSNKPNPVTTTYTYDPGSTRSRPSRIRCTTSRRTATTMPAI
jgi:YD repeat-containing protein